MGLFDSDFSNPSSMYPLLGLIQGLGQASAPSRLPVSFGQVLGDAAGGYMQGLQSQTEAQQNALRSADARLGINSKLANVNFMRQLSGRKPLTYDDIVKGNFDDVPQATVASSLTPTASTPATVAAAPVQQTALIPGINTSAIASVESNNNPGAVSPVGAVGTMQTMPSTLRDPGFGVRPAQNNSPEEQTRVGQDYIAALQKKYNDPVLAHIAYNWGPGNTDKWLASGAKFSALPTETQAYLGRIAVEQSKRTPHEIAAVAPTQVGETQPNNMGGLIPADLMANPLFQAAVQSQDSDTVMKMIMAHQTKLTPEELKANNLPPDTLAFRKADGSLNIENKGIIKSPEQIANEAQAAKAKAEAMSEPYDPDTINFMAEQALAGDTSVFQSMGFGNTGAVNRKALRNRIALLASERGLTGRDIAALNAEFFGLKAGERTLGTRTANVEMAVTEAQQMIPLALAASKAVPRTSFPTLNSVLLSAQQGTGDENVVRLAIATNSLINTYARAINPNGVPTVNDKEHARELLSKAWANGQYEAGVDQLSKEMAAARKSPGVVRGEFRNAISGGGQNGPAMVPDAPAQGAPKPNQSGATTGQKVLKATAKDLQETALKNHMTVEQVKQRFRDEGYQVP